MNIQCGIDKFPSVCLEGKQRSLTLRGLCEDTEIDSLYNFAIDTENALYFAGNRFCFIMYDKIRHYWDVVSVMSTVSADIK